MAECSLHRMNKVEYQGRWHSKNQDLPVPIDISLFSRKLQSPFAGRSSGLSGGLTTFPPSVWKTVAESDVKHPYWTYSYGDSS